MSSSQTQSFWKSGTKTGLDTTRYTTMAGTGSFDVTSKTLGQVHVSDSVTQQPKQNGWAKQSKIDQAYWQTRSVIDQLIGIMQQKRDGNRSAFKTVGDTNQYILDTLNEQYSTDQPIQYVQPTYTQPIPTYYASTIRQGPIVSQVDLQKLQLLKVIQSQRLYNQNITRRCQQLNDQNNYLKVSHATTKLGYSTRQPIMNVSKQHVYQQQAQGMDQTRMLFAQLQNLKQENQILRQQTIKLLKNQY